jgi:hypothetical protein
LEKQRELFDNLAIKWKLQKPEDWLKVTIKNVVKEGGSFIHIFYNGSVLQGMKN